MATENNGDNGLTSLRLRLDGVDRQLQESLRQRLRLCEEIGRYKREHAIAVMQPNRIDRVVETAREFAMQNSMSPDYLESVYRLIIEETVRVEELVVGRPADRTNGTA